MERGVIVQPTYRVRSGRPVVQLHGRLESGRPFLVEDDRFRPYIFVRTRDVGELPDRPDISSIDTPLSSMDGHPVSRVTLAHPRDVPAVRDPLLDRGIPVYQADIRFPYLYLMHHGLRSEITIDGPCVPGASDFGPVVFQNPRLEPAETPATPIALRWLSLDIETTPDAGRVLSFAYVTSLGEEEVHVVSLEPVAGATAHADERALLVTFAARMRTHDPDLVLGWNVVDFDLRVVCERFDALELSAAECELGRTPGRTDFPSNPNFTRQARANVPGRMVLDGIALVRDALRLPDYRLETVAQHVLGRGKRIEESATLGKAEEILRLYYEDVAAFVAYNLEDARLVPELLEREQLLDLTQQRSGLTGMQMDRVSASIASFDLVYLPLLAEAGYVAPCVDSERSSQPIRGGAVLDAVAGLSEGVAVFDFKSLYPSLIRTFNLDPLALALGRDAPDGDALEAPNGALVHRDAAPLPRIIGRFMEQRARAKAAGRPHASQAIKIMMNSMFGIFASPACRFYSPDLANAITQFGQQTLIWTRDAMQALGYAVLYGDTDSLFVALGPANNDDELRTRADEIRAQVEAVVSMRIRETYGVEAFLDLELEKIFSRFFLPHVRGGGGASKKRYAGWTLGDGPQLEIVGLEAVRRDWPRAAGRLQEELLERVFRDRASELMPHVRARVEALRAGELDDELVYVKRVRKGVLDRYTVSSPPHVQAARKIEERTGRFDGPVVRYLITATGAEPLISGEPAPTAIDYPHYIDRVLRPVAEAILCEFDGSFDEALGEPRQLNLL